jgi:hypothetical protein
MTDHEIQIKRIFEKLQQLLKLNDDLLRENKKLKKEITKSQSQSLANLATIENLRQQVEILKISAGDWDEKDKKEFEKRIGHYIREIDKCIALLSD